MLAAALRGKVTVVEGEPYHQGMPNTRNIKVKDFPGLIRGFQGTGRRPDGKHYHPWARRYGAEPVDVSADTFRVQRGGRVFEYHRSAL